MFSSKHLDFHFPLFTTCIHMLVQFSLASLVLYLFPRFRPRADSISNPHNLAPSSPESTLADKPLMTRTFYLTRIGPCGAATGLDIGLGNMSLKFITLTFFSEFSKLSLAPTLLIRSPSDVQIVGLGFCAHLRVLVPPRNALDQINSYYRYYDHRCCYDGRR